MVRESELLPSFGQDSIRYASQNVQDTTQHALHVEVDPKNPVQADNSTLSENSSESFFGLDDNFDQPCGPLEELDVSYEEKVTLKDGSG